MNWLNREIRYELILCTWKSHLKFFIKYKKYFRSVEKLVKHDYFGVSMPQESV